VNTKAILVNVVVSEIIGYDNLSSRITVRSVIVTVITSDDSDCAGLDAYVRAGQFGRSRLRRN